jgi:hypothetical protein
LDENSIIGPVSGQALEELYRSLTVFAHNTGGCSRFIHYN